jgi:acetoin utilization protein AcuC
LLEWADALRNGVRRVTRVTLIYDPAMAEYRFGPSHPLLPERFVLAVELARAWGLLGEGELQAGVVAPEPATDEDLARVHSADYIEAVKGDRVSAFADESHGLGDGDTPRFANMHAVSALIAGGTIQALERVLDGSSMRAFNPAGGLHHSHRARAAGFCVYNDCAIAIARATERNSGTRVAYVDIDAHHGDGVEEAFRARSDVLTISVHESGRYLYPGTGASGDIGEGPGRGYAINVPLPPYSGPAEYLACFERVVEPALRAFGPDVIVAQLGADSYRLDPLTHLGMTVAGHVESVSRIARISDELCGGRLVATGGGGYEAFSATPRMWACALAVMLGLQPPPQLPASWIELSSRAAERLGADPVNVTGTFDEPVLEPDAVGGDTMRLAVHAIQQTIDCSPLLTGKVG